MSNELFILLVLAALQVFRVAALQVAISPEYVRVDRQHRNVTFTCVADSALVGCEFSWWDWVAKGAGHRLDLSQGSQSQADPAHLSRWWLTGYRYTGRGLGAGDCGITLQVASDRKQWIVACRVRGEMGGWQYAWASLYANAWGTIPHNLTTPREVVVLPGGKARFSVKVQEQLSFCYFFVPGEPGRLNYNSSGREPYLLTRPKNEECDLELSGISKADNGLVTVYLHGLPVTDEVRFMALIVANPPPAPTISLAYTGTNLTATCRVGNSRPVANITWILGDKVIRQDENDDSQAGSNDTWRWPWMEGSIVQILTLQLKPEYQGQVLKCVVSHVALVQPHEAWSEIVIPGATRATTTGTTTSATPLTISSTAPSTTKSTASCTTSSTAPSATTSTASSTTSSNATKVVDN